MSDLDLLPLGLPDWHTEAACAGRTTLFYASDKVSEAIAIAVCRRCPVRVECLAEAQRIEATGLRWGVRAGLRPADRGVSQRQGMMPG